MDLIDELIAEDLVDHVDVPGLEGRGRARYRASIEMMQAAFPNYRNPLDYLAPDGLLVTDASHALDTRSSFPGSGSLAAIL